MSLTPYLHLDDSLADAGPGTVLALPPDASSHLTRVLRLRPGAPVEVSDGAGRVASAVLDDRKVRLTSPVRTHAQPTPRITVAQAPPKGRGFDEVVRSLTELGVDAVTPLSTERGVARFDGERLQKASARWRAVARAASEQSRRPWRVELTGMRSLGEVVADRGSCLVAHPGARPLPDVLRDWTGQDVTLVVGPEGGFSDEEVRRATALEAVLVGLGASVLRTEHAAAAATAVVAATVGRWAESDASWPGHPEPGG